MDFEMFVYFSLIFFKKVAASRPAIPLSGMPLSQFGGLMLRSRIRD
jgi:hypothetical protein